MERRIAIVARSPSSRYLAPIHDDTWEIWTLSPFTCNEGFTDLPRWDRWYELHDLGYVEGENPGYRAWLESQENEKVYTQDKFPIGCIVDRFGVDYFTSSIAYMIAHACWEHDSADPVRQIGIYGTDMAHKTEYAHQRPCVEFWLGVATGLSIDVVVPAESDLIKHRQRYGYDRPSPMQAKLNAREEELRTRIDDAERIIEEIRAETARVVGCKTELAAVSEMLNGCGSEELLKQLGERSLGYDRLIERYYADAKRKEAEQNQLLGACEEINYERQWI